MNEKTNTELEVLKQDEKTKIELAFSAKIKEREGYITIYDQIIKSELTEDTCNQAYELRKKLVKVRTGIAAIHKTQKAYFLAAGKFVDEWKNKETLPVIQMEESLTKIEKHFENLEKARLEALQSERVELISAYVEDANERDLSGMDNDVWEAYLSTKKKAFEDEQQRIKEEEERQAELKRKSDLEIERRHKTSRLADYINKYDSIVFSDLSDEGYDKLCSDAIKARAQYEAKQEQIRLDNERLKKQAEEAEKQRLVEIKERELKVEKERLERERLAKIESDKQAKILADEKAKSDKLAADLKAKEEAEKQRLIDEENQKQSELQKGDADKIKDLVNDLEEMKTKYSFRSQKNQTMYASVSMKLQNIIESI